MWKRILASLWLCQLAACRNANQTSFVEVDLVFPRDEQTYAPMPMMPIVFSVYDPNGVAKWLNLQILFQLTNDHNGNLQSRTRQLTVDMPEKNGTHYVYDTIRHVAETEGSWKFSWTLTYSNCIDSEDYDYYDSDEQAPTLVDIEQQVEGTVSFNTKNDGKKPDLQDNDNCDSRLVQQYGIEEVFSAPSQFANPYPVTQASCASLQYSEPTARPCSITVDAAAASSVSAQMTASECSKYKKTVATCPAESTAAGVQASLSSCVALIASCIVGMAFVL